MNKFVQGNSGSVSHSDLPGITFDVDVLVQIEEDCSFTLSQGDIDYVIEAAIDMLLDRIEENE